ncbi:MAG: PQQ-dependent sugar dehydrogenase [Phenylobacterium sp.]|nr:PQQ-dependent sugar dehydrogenase [Phenylobacterium sp.]
MTPKTARLALILALMAGTSMAQGVETRPPITPYKPAFEGQTRAPEQKLGVAFQVATVAEGLRFPWAIAVLPDSRLLVTEKAGALRLIGRDGKVSEPIPGTPEVLNRGQGGLLDVVLDPAFARNRLIYLSFAQEASDGTNGTAVVRAKFVDGPTPRLDEVTEIFRQTPTLNSPAHFGSRLVWSRDNKLFVTLGDRYLGMAQAQDLNSLIGKIARITADGAAVRDNPFVGQADARPEIWSYGHRNVQAAALHPDTGELWVVEYGPQAGDEINIARKGKNYGWPIIGYGVNYGPAKTPITGGETQRAGMEQPLYYWDPSLAPSGAIFYTGAAFPAWRGSLIVAGQQPQGLPGGNLTRLTIKDERVVGEERLDLPGALWRDIRQAPDGSILLLQGGPAGKVLRLSPKG